MVTEICVNLVVSRKNSKMFLKLWIALALCFSANGQLLDTSSTNVLSEILPSLDLNTCLLDVTTVLSVFYGKECDTCKGLCNGLAGLTKPLTDLLAQEAVSKSSVDFHCVKA